MFTTTPDNHVGHVNPRNIKPSINSLRKIKKWYKSIIKKSNTKVIKINLSECRDWQMNNKNINIIKINKFENALYLYRVDDK
jgi:hypothetical protein